MKPIAMITIPAIILLVAGCASSSPEVITQIEYQRIDIPNSLLTCRSNPVAPENATLQSEVARYIVALDSAGEDCRRKLQSVRNLINSQ